jgi:quercetin dioxygenase-like cupin family protein
MASVEIHRFGVGHRRPEGPPGTVGVTGQLIHSDARGLVAELAFARRASVPLHSNANTTWFLVLEGGGFVQVGAERARIGAGEAVEWPAGVDHSAWTELSEMRAIVVELAGRDDAVVRGLIEAGASAQSAGVPRGSSGQVERGEGRLVDPPGRVARAAEEGEPE